MLARRRTRQLRHAASTTVDFGADRCGWGAGLRLLWRHLALSPPRRLRSTPPTCVRNSCGGGVRHHFCFSRGPYLCVGYDDIDYLVYGYDNFGTQHRQRPRGIEAIPIDRAGTAARRPTCATSICIDDDMVNLYHSAQNSTCVVGARKFVYFFFFFFTISCFHFFFRD